MRLCLTAISALVVFSNCTIEAICQEMEECARINNEGVRALNAKQYDQAIKLFEVSLKVKPDYSIAKDNLIIVHLRRGIQLRSEGKLEESLRELHMVAIDTHHWDDELSQTIKKLGKNPNLFEDRVALASAAQDKGDLDGAVVEYLAALNLKKDAEISSRLEKAQVALANRKNETPKVEH
jgi:tetratricopeptide (TPR) repeat protein